uniref:Uncharacterized protein n=1 Tax=Pectobacterium versatile TaxID=2488639 RepID=A0A855MCX6_9GAMM|nr:hypothetical protein F131LOC_03000 [Pectobacterium versatile]
MSVTFCMMIPFRKKNTLSAYRSQGGGDHLINPETFSRFWIFIVNHAGRVSGRFLRYLITPEA